MGKRPVTLRKPDEALEKKLCPLCPWNQVLAVDAGRKESEAWVQALFLGLTSRGPGLGEYGGRAGSWGLRAGLQTMGPVCFVILLKALSWPTGFRGHELKCQWAGSPCKKDRVQHTNSRALFSFWVFQLVHCGTHLILVVVPFFWRAFLFVCFRK